jgi:hypothetical protein
MSTSGSVRSSGPADDLAAVRRRAAAVVRAAGTQRPPFFPERYAARCGVSAIVAARLHGQAVTVEHRLGETGGGRRTLVLIDRRLPPHTPQWNGAVALGLGETLVPDGAAEALRPMLAEAAAAELLLPMAVFRPAASRTDLTADGVRELAVRFAAPLRLTARQWLASGLWRGFALLWREEAGAVRLLWRAASPGRIPAVLALGVDAATVWAPESRLFATQRTGRPHHGVEEVRLGGETAWWFVRFAPVRGWPDPADRAGHRAVFAMVMLDRGASAAGGAAPARRVRRHARPEGMAAGRTK